MVYLSPESASFGHLEWSVLPPVLGQDFLLVAWWELEILGLILNELNHSCVRFEYPFILSMLDNDPKSSNNLICLEWVDMLPFSFIIASGQIARGPSLIRSDYSWNLIILDILPHFCFDFKRSLSHLYFFLFSFRGSFEDWLFCLLLVLHRHLF